MKAQHNDDEDDSPDFSGSGQMALNVGKANHVQASVDDMINTLAELYQTNAYWKNKYLQDRYVLLLVLPVGVGLVY